MLDDIRKKGERFELRVSETTLDRIDEWRRRQEDVPSRAEAMRRLVENGLAQSAPTSITFRPAEKLIVKMLCDLKRGPRSKEGCDENLILDIMYGGHYWALDRHDGPVPHLFHNHVDREEDANFVVDVLEMWDRIESDYQKLSKKDKDWIATEATHPLGKIVKFRGFDELERNGERNLLHITRFMIDQLGRFQAFKGRDLNSHMPMASVYERMYGAYEPIRPTLIGTLLSPTQIIEILKAGSNLASR